VNPWGAALALVAAEAVSRAALVRLWQELPAAKLSGLAHETGPPTQNAMLFALAVGAAIALLLVWPTAGFGPLLVAILLAALATYIRDRRQDRRYPGRLPTDRRRRVSSRNRGRRLSIE
jgi:adenosylcobinamide-GDP ribazoletransferase